MRDVEPYPDELLQLDEPQSIGPLYRDGHLRMKGKGQAQLHGTLYVTGDLRIDSDFGVALNGHTIYAGGEIEFKPGSRLSSPGCIIAAGDIYFSPKMENDAFVLVLSLGGKVTAKPNNTLYGSLAGYESVELESNAVLEWTPPPDTLNFPGFTLLDDALGIITYSIIRL